MSHLTFQIRKIIKRITPLFNMNATYFIIFFRQRKPGYQVGNDDLALIVNMFQGIFVLLINE